MGCDMCGSDGFTMPAIVEGVEMKVCVKCSGFGRVLKPKTAPRTIEVRKRERQSRPLFAEESAYVVDDFSGILKKARQSQGILMKDFCKEMNIKESYYASIESGKTRPPLALATRLQKKLRVKIVESGSGEEVKVSSSSSEGLTIGDLMKK